MPKFFKQNLLSAPKELPAPDMDFGDDPRLNFNPIKTLLSWKAPSRPYRKKDRSYYTTAILLLVIVSAIAFLFGERLLIGALLAFGFIVYVLNFITPEEIDYKISTQGITIGEHFYHWQELNSFWLSEKDGFKTLNIPTYLRFPAQLIVPIGEVNEEQIKRIVGRFLPFHEIAPKTMLDRWSESLQKHFPLENPHR